RHWPPSRPSRRLPTTRPGPENRWAVAALTSHPPRRRKSILFHRLHSPAFSRRPSQDKSQPQALATSRGRRPIVLRSMPCHVASGDGTYKRERRGDFAKKVVGDVEGRSIDANGRSD